MTMNNENLSAESKSNIQSKTENMIENKAKRKTLPNWLKTSLAILVSVALLAFYFKDIDWVEFFKLLENADLKLAFAATLISQLVVWFFTIYQTERVFTWFDKAFDWKSYLWVRGVLYIIMIVNTGLGNAGNALYLQQKTQMSWLKFIAIGFFRAALSMGGVGLFMIPLTIGMHVLGLFEKTPLNPWLWWSIMILGQYLLLDAWLYFNKGKTLGLSALLFTNGEVDGVLVGGFRNRNHPIWMAFREANTIQWLLVMFWMLIPVGSLVLGYWFMVQAFNIEIPWFLFLATIAFVIALQDLPIAFAGFGATTFAWELFYGDFASTEAIAGLTLSIPILRLIVRAMIGLVSMKPAISDIANIIEEHKKGRGVSVFAMSSGEVATKVSENEMQEAAMPEVPSKP